MNSPNITAWSINDPALHIRTLTCGYALPWRDEKTLVMLQAHVDESGNDGKSSSLVLAGYVLPAAKWIDFSADWEAVLSDPKLPIKYFHMREAEAGKGQFLGIAAEFRRMKIRDLLAVIEKYEPLGLVCQIAFADFSRLLRPRVKEDFKSEYYPLFDWIIKKLFVYQLAQKEFGSVDFIFDEQAKFIMDNAIKIYCGIKEEAGPKLREMLGATPIFRDDKKIRPLQAADMLAWHKRREIDFPFEDREITRRLDDTVSFEEVLDERYINSFL